MKMTRDAAPHAVAAHRARPDGGELLADRLRACLSMALIGVVVLGLGDLALQPALLSPLLAIKLALSALLGTALARTRATSSRMELITIAVAVMSGIYVAIALTSVASDDFVYTPLVVIAASMISATTLPWGAKAQVASVSVALAVAFASFLTASGDGSTSRAGYGMVAVALGCVASVYVAYERERVRLERARVSYLLDAQTTILEMISLRRPLEDVLTFLSGVVERQSDGLLCSVLLLEDGRLHNAAAPSLPAAYSQAIEGIAIGPAAGSCGTAAFHRRTVVVEDIARDPLWAEFRDVAAAHGLRACWSSPIVATDGTCLGTFAMYYREPRGPDAHAWYVLGVATHLAGIAIERSQTEEALAGWRRQLEEESQVAHALVQAGHEVISTLSAPEILARLCQLTTELVRCDCSDTVFRDLDDDSYVPHSAHGYSVEEWESLRTLQMSAEGLRPLLAALERDELVQVRTRDCTDSVMTGLLRRYGITVSMYVALRRGSEVIGILSCAYRGSEELFTRVQQRVARGIAHLASLALENARLIEEVRAASQLKSEFVSTMSHELRTPLSVILGYTEMLEEDLPRQEQERTLSKIRRSGLELLEMIETTLNLSRIEAGRDQPHFERVHMGELVDEIAAEYGAIERPVSTVLRWDVSANAELVTDRRKLKIVVKNLVGNAIKFTPHGEVVVSGCVEGGVCTLVVRDTGVGIPSEHLPVIFEMFRQVDNSDSRSYGGVGLGLYIVRRLLTQLGGAVDVESELGRGTRFTIVLPSRSRAEEHSVS